MEELIAAIEEASNYQSPSMENMSKHLLLMALQLHTYCNIHYKYRHAAALAFAKKDEDERLRLEDAASQPLYQAPKAKQKPRRNKEGTYPTT